MTDPSDRRDRIARLADQLRAHNTKLGLSEPINDLVVRAFLLGVRVGQGGTIPELDEDSGEWVWPKAMKPQA